MKLIQGDCLEQMKAIPDNSIDLVLTDPPYGKKADKGTNGFGSAKNRRYAGNWDNTRPQKEIFDEIFRISKNVIIERDFIGIELDKNYFDIACKRIQEAKEQLKSEVNPLD